MWTTIRTRYKWVLLVAVVVLFTAGILFFYFGGFQNSTHSIHRVKDKTAEFPDFYQEVAAQLLELSRELRSSSGKINPHVPRRINKIIAQMYPSLMVSEQNLGTALRVSPENKPIEEVCGEKFMGSSYGRPFFQEGFVLESCSHAKSIGKLVTVLLNFVGVTENRLNNFNTVLETIAQYKSDLPVLLASSNKLAARIASQYSNVHIVSFSETARVGEVWNGLTKEVNTSYALLARDITHFSTYVRLERQIRVISSVDSVSVAGGAFRNLSGHWKVGCHQIDRKNYFLKFHEGYYYSTEDCMFCDYLEGPFLTKTALLHQIPFTEELPGEVVFEDWFLQLKHGGILVLNCPDVMYFTQGISEASKMRRDSWLSLARQWDTHNIFIPPNIVYQFSCKELDFPCKLTKASNMCLIPPCCQIEMSHMLKNVNNLTLHDGLQYELVSDCLLGAVKLRDYLPWTSDCDMGITTKDYEVFKKEQKYLKSKGLKLDSLSVHAKDINLNLKIYDKLSANYLSEKLKNIPTKLEIGDVWVCGQVNPGLYSRNKYGPNYLKLSQNHMVSAEKKNSLGVEKFPQCLNPTHRTCLDQYSADGNIDYIS